MKKRVAAAQPHLVATKLVGQAGFPVSVITDCLMQGDKIVIIHRHGESYGSKQKNPHDNFNHLLFSNHSVNQLSASLSPLKVKLIKAFSSPFPRTIETAKTYADEIVLRSDLSEMAMTGNPGWDFSKLSKSEILEGLTPYQQLMPETSLDEIADQVVALYANTPKDTDWGTPLTESPGRTRMAEALCQIARDTEPGTISTVSTHGFVVTPHFVSTCFAGDEFQMPLTHNPDPDRGHDKFGPDYCSAVILRISPSGPSEVLCFWRPTLLTDGSGM